MGELNLIGIGPGDAAYLTREAEDALRMADVLCGYTLYIDLVRERYPDKEIYTTPMTKEVDRCRWAIEQAALGKRVALLSSGDAGVYGMAGLVLEMTADRPEVEVRVIPGITAALSGAAVLGAPLMNDFCVLSLSDRLTPWEKIERRLRCAAEGDLVICLYNPASKSRRDHLRRAVNILLEILSPEIVCGYVRNIGRSGTESGILTLLELQDFQADMFTTVFIGNRGTRNISGKMITKRGYEAKL